jgi:hypothetical protein
VGNGHLREGLFVNAVEAYRQALAGWDHPAIHYNLALALLNLDQPVEVYQHMEAAIRYGPEPLDAQKFEYARSIKTLLEKQLAWVEISCELPGATVTMDGKTLFVAPGRFRGLVRSGMHSILATHEGYETDDQSRALLPGERVTFALAPAEIVFKRKWPVWMPWAVMSAGAAVAAGGGFFHVRARDDFRAFDAGVTECGGCVPEPRLADTRARGFLQQKLAVSTYTLGGAALVGGVVLAFLNQPQPHRIKPGQGDKRVTVVPLLGGGANGILTTFRF